MFDLLIKNGTVVDPGAGLEGALDVAISRDRIAAVDRDIPGGSAREVIDASGLFITPGLVDLHTHAFFSGSYWGIDPDPIMARSGATTWLDVGSAGAYNWLAFRNFIIQKAQTRIYGLLNISSIGLTAPNWELANPNYCDVDMCCKMIHLHHDILLGVKARVDAGTTGNAGLTGLQRAREAADRLRVPLMVHIAAGPPELEDILGHLKPGDILTHCCTGRSNRLITNSGALRDVARRARDAGVIMDVGHGAGSFAWESAERMLADGFAPDVISSDIHQLAALGPCFDLPTCLSKFMALGMSLPEVVLRATAKPAGVMGLAGEIGTLKPGAKADVALFKLCEGSFPLYDIFMNRREGKQLLVNTLTILNGRPMPRLPEPPPMPWIEPDDDQRALQERGHVPHVMCGC
jgi:dihydroorotase